MKDYYRYGFYRLLEATVGYGHDASFSLYDCQEQANLRSKAELNKREIFIQLGAAKDALGDNVARHMLLDEARELARLYADLADDVRAALAMEEEQAEAQA